MLPNVGVSVTNLRRWHREGKLVQDHTPGGPFRYNVVTLCPGTSPALSRKTVAGLDW